MAPKKELINGKEATIPGEEAAFLGGELGAKIQARIDGLGEDNQCVFEGMPAPKRRAAEMAYYQIREVQQVLDAAKAHHLFAGRRAVDLFPYVMFPLEILFANNIEPIDKLVWLVLFRHALDKRTSWPSQKKISREVSKSVRVVQRSLDKLEKEGYISRRLRKVRGLMYFNEYQLNINIDKITTRQSDTKEGNND